MTPDPAETPFAKTPYNSLEKFFRPVIFLVRMVLFTSIRSRVGVSGESPESVERVFPETVPETFWRLFGVPGPEAPVGLPQMGV